MRGQRDHVLPSVASWTAAGGGLGPSISHLTLHAPSTVGGGGASATSTVLTGASSMQVRA